MKKAITILLFGFCAFLNAQSKLTFTYDPAGNQTSRVLCINCLSQTAKTIVETADAADSDLEKLSAKDVISYYPNPVKEELHLEWQLVQDNSVASVNIYAVTGQLLRAFQTSDSANSLSIPFQQYPTGVYLVVLSYKNGGEKSIKIIKQ